MKNKYQNLNYYINLPIFINGIFFFYKYYIFKKIQIRIVPSDLLSLNHKNMKSPTTKVCITSAKIR